MSATTEEQESNTEWQKDNKLFRSFFLSSRLRQLNVFTRFKILFQGSPLSAVYFYIPYFKIPWYFRPSCLPILSIQSFFSRFLYVENSR